MKSRNPFTFKAIKPFQKKKGSAFEGIRPSLPWKIPAFVYTLYPRSFGPWHWHSAFRNYHKLEANRGINYGLSRLFWTRCILSSLLRLPRNLNCGHLQSVREAVTLKLSWLKPTYKDLDFLEPVSLVRTYHGRRADIPHSLPLYASFFIWSANISTFQVF